MNIYGKFDIAEHQLLRLADAFPPDRYAWRPADTARSVREVLVHVAVVNLMLLGIVGVESTLRDGMSCIQQRAAIDVPGLMHMGISC